ncbi:general stress protein [Actinomyces radicidentis]|uniref:general stress protein n=1 Tax=Actinomyces radicidentis TaxID=111015 RepID=UPI0028E8CFB5|nr:general stress protein [Actinomyces radicidentis]
MSQFSAQGLSVSAGRGGMPRGEEVASFTTYSEAQAAVDSLSDEGYPVQVLAIIGTDLRQVENITGRMSWGRAAIQGAGTGLWLGTFFVLMMSFIGPDGSGGLTFATGILLGIVWGVVFQLIGYAFTRGRRDFTSTSHVVASRYSIIASEQAGEAAQALAHAPGNLTRGGAAARRAEERRAARAEARGTGPTAFGSRPDEEPRFGVRVPEGESAERIAAPLAPAAPSDVDASAPSAVDAAPRPAYGAVSEPVQPVEPVDQVQPVEPVQLIEPSDADAPEHDPDERPFEGRPRD